jgi:uncharacterized surface protein with fasciclin (FAS1) repeats
MQFHTKQSFIGVGVMNRFQKIVVSIGFAAIIGITVDAAIAADAEMDIVDTAVAAGDFRTLAAALTAADLVETLKGDGPFTVFAPTDAAFAKLPAGTVEHLLMAENIDQLTAILTYHVVPGSVTADQVVGLSSAATVNGQSIDISTSGSNVMINDANVVAADIMASNGVIHVIDTVILPK